jgi:hypothetical protein
MAAYREVEDLQVVLVDVCDALVDVVVLPLSDSLWVSQPGWRFEVFLIIIH